MSKPLRLLSIGAGAIGTYVGGSLALKGHRVVFVELPAVAESLRTRGLKLSLSGTEHNLRDTPVFGSMEDALEDREYDVALFALKSFDTPVFLESLNVPAKDMPPFLCLSNGVGNEPAMAAKFGLEKIIAGTVTSSIGLRNAGDVVLERLRGVGVAAGHALSERLVAVMDEAGLNAKLFASEAGMKWTKLLTNLLANASSAILDMSPAEIFSHPEIYRLEIRQLREVLRVMSARGINVVSLPGVPTRSLAFVVKHLPPVLSQPLLRKRVGGGRGGKMPSFHIDLHAGRGKSEVDFYNGAVVRAGEEAGIPAPVNRLLNEKLLALTRGEIPMDHYRSQPEKLMGELEG